MPSEITWEEPPRASTGTHRKAANTAREIAARPNTWACVGTYQDHDAAKSRAYRIRKGDVDAYSMIGKFDATCRRVPEGWKVYVKYIPRRTS